MTRSVPGPATIAALAAGALLATPALAGIGPSFHSLGHRTGPVVGGEEFGSLATGVGDVDGDGYDDVVVCDSSTTFQGAYLYRG